jgi:hypothetical protein
MYGEAPSSLLPDALATARAQHYAVAGLDTERNEFVALPAANAAVQTAMVVRLDVSGWRCARRERNCGIGSRTSVAVTPVAFRGGHALPAEAVPAAARETADDLSWAILDSARR